MTLLSVIIPVYRNTTGLRKLIGALEKSTPPPCEFEVLVVDNGSESADIEWMRESVERSSLNAKLLCEHGAVGSYAARNLGIEHAIGSLIAFIDSDCLPKADWLAEGIKPLLEGTADLVGGQVCFTFTDSENPTGAELYDSMTNMQMEDCIRKRGEAKTANLFCTRACFDKVGRFPDDVTSGGDVIWTRNATSAGLRLVYSPNAIVEHPARDMQELKQKQIRVGFGQMEIFRRNGRSKTSVFRDTLARLLPPLPWKIRRYIKKNPIVAQQKYYWKIWYVRWIVGVALAKGRILYIYLQYKTLDNVPR